jgi:amino acid transporter
MASSENVIPVTAGSSPVERPDHAIATDRLHANALGLPAILFMCVAAIAPAASMLFNVPVMASQAGAATPLAFVLSAVGVLLLGVPVVYFARRLSSAGGFATWVRHGLGRGAAFQAGWLMLGAYALFEAALQATVGGSLESLLSPLGVNPPGGWVGYALVLTLLVGVLAYFDIRASIWAMAPFAVAEVLALLLLDAAITIKGGATGQDIVHTFTPVGANLSGVAPGGTLGIGIAMVLGILAFVGFETGAVYGEEARNPHRTIPLALFSLLVFLAVLYIWTSYAATIGVGWQHAGSVLGNVNVAPQQYVMLAGVYVGHWLGVALAVFVLTSNVASSFAMHQAMVRYTLQHGPRRDFASRPRQDPSSLEKPVSCHHPAKRLDLPGDSLSGTDYPASECRWQRYLRDWVRERDKLAANEWHRFLRLACQHRHHLHYSGLHPDERCRSVLCP